MNPSRQLLRLPSLVWMALLSLLIAGATIERPRAADAPQPAQPDSFKPILPNIALQDGDTFVFLGDSITHQCLYTQYIEDYFYTRYPRRRIHFHNAGVGGDRAIDALVRFDEDVAAFKPKYVTILLGMNDGRYTDFHQDIFDTYQHDMTELLGRLNGIGALTVPMTPTMFDSTAARLRRPQEPRDTYYNGVLALYGAWLREQALSRGLGFVDMYSPLNHLTTGQRQKNPAFTWIPDAIHPDANGHVVMAAAILEDMVPPTPVSVINLVVQRDGPPTAQVRRGNVSDLEQGDHELQFRFQAQSLPWVLPPQAADGYRLTHSGHRFSRERLALAGAPAGDYRLTIDGQEIGTYSALELGRGIELQNNEKTPEYQQALKVALLNQERNQKAIHPLRDQWSAMKRQRREERWLAEHPNDPEAPKRQKAFDEWLETFHSKVKHFHELADEYESKIYEANRPEPHTYKISRVEPGN